MEAKINIATILKDKPEGTKLWTDMFGSVTLYVVTDACDSFQVKHHNKEPWFDKEGKLCKEGVLCIYPSKSMRDWEKFAWKKGDVLISNDGKVKVIFEKFRNDTYLSFIGKHHLDSIECNNPYYQHEGEYATGSFKLEEVDTAQTYINTIEERLGGKLNRETLEVEKAQPEFNDGDIAFADYGNRQSHFSIINKGVRTDYNIIFKRIDNGKLFPCKDVEYEDYIQYQLNRKYDITEEDMQELSGIYNRDFYK